MKHTDEWPVWDGTENLHGRRIRLDYPNGTAYAVGIAERHRPDAPQFRHVYFIEGTPIMFGSIPHRVRVAPEGER